MGRLRVLCQVYHSHKAAIERAVVLEVACGDYHSRSCYWQAMFNSQSCYFQPLRHLFFTANVTFLKILNSKFYVWAVFKESYTRGKVNFTAILTDKPDNEQQSAAGSYFRSGLFAWEVCQLFQSKRTRWKNNGCKKQFLGKKKQEEHCYWKWATHREKQCIFIPNPHIMLLKSPKEQWYHKLN